MRLDAEIEVAQDLRPETVAQSHIFESDHVLLRAPPKLVSRFAFYSSAPTYRPIPAACCTSGLHRRLAGTPVPRPDMVSDPLTVACYRPGGHPGWPLICRC